MAAKTLLSRVETIEKYKKIIEAATESGELDLVMRELMKNDLFFLLIYGLNTISFANNDWVFDRCREFEADRDGFLDLWPREHFKDLPLDIPMLTQNRGWTTHGDLVVGDRVFAPSGKAVEVLALSPRYSMNRCLKITFQDGKEITCGEGHLWRVRDKYRGKRDESGHRESLRRERIVEARDLEVGDDIGAIEGPISYPEANFPVHPYVLGAWLGDGSSDSPVITCSYEDIDIPMKIASLGYEVKEGKPRDGRTGKYAFGGGIRGKKNTGVFPLFRALGVVKNKHIPRIYFEGSIQQRTDLLHGLMDTDGTCNERGNASFCNSNETLARDVYELAAGLALRPRISRYWTTCNGAGKFPMWVVSFQQHSDRPVFSLHRKEKNAIKPSAHRACRRVVSIAEADPVDTSCIQVEGGMYLAGRDLIPTHNSTIITLAAAIQEILRDPEITIGIFSFNRPAAKVFLRAIKMQFEQNTRLKELFPEILYTDPEKESPKWSLDSSTPVLTTRGWKRHGDLSSGDFVFGSDGNPTEVLGNSGESIVEAYEVVFDDCTIIASKDHIWPVMKRGTTNATHGEWSIVNLTTSELKPKDKRYRHLSTPLVHSIGENGDLPLDPYILGLWLGNGTIGTNIITFNNEYLDDGIKQIESAGYTHYVHRMKPEDNFTMIAIDDLKRQLKELGVNSEKRIPEQYLYSDEPTRRALLQGLMDSDGTCKKNSIYRAAGMCMFSNTNKNIADGVYFLATSLGMRPSMVRFTPKARAKKEVYQVYFVGVRGNSPFRLPQKIGRCKESRVKLGRYLRDVRPAGLVAVNCIKVAAKDSLYLAGKNLVPTHNSEDDGITVKRKGLPKEMTVEAYGVVDGMPTGRHYKLRIYDDLVVKESVSSPEMINKVTEAVSLSFNLGSIQSDRMWMVGTRYHLADTYSVLVSRGAVKIRMYGATKDGKFDGEPWLWTREQLAKKVKDMGTYVASCQLFNNPVMEGEQTFNVDWLRYWSPKTWSKMNTYILVDPANSKTKKSDYTVIAVIGLGPDQNYYLIDMVRDKLTVRERSQRVMALHSQYRPKAVGYEKYGIQTDIDFLEEMQNQAQYRFKVIPLGGNMAKTDRIKRIQPIFEAGRFYLPEKLIRVDYQGIAQDLTQSFINDEYLQFPYMTHDDMLDCISRIVEDDLKTFFPSPGKIDPRTGREVIDEDDDQGYTYSTYDYLDSKRRPSWQ